MMPLGATAPPSRRRGPLIVLTIATLVVIPLVIRDLTSDDGPERARSGTSVTTTAAPTTVRDAPATTAAPGPATPVTVALDPRWVPKGSSRYSESDEQTQARISKESSAITTTAAPTTAPRPTTSTRAGVTTTTIRAAVRTTVPATAAPATSPPTTAAPPPPTEPPATVAPAAAAPPAPGG